MLDQVEVVLRDYRPDVVIVDQQTLAGAVAATFLTDATSGTMKVARAMRRRNNNIRVADNH